MENQQELRKCMGFRFKSVTTSGNHCKNYIKVFDNGVVYLVQFILSEHPDMGGFEKITTRFGKTLYKKDIALKFTTLNTIHKHSCNILSQMKVKLEDIL